MNYLLAKHKKEQRIKWGLLLGLVTIFILLGYSGVFARVGKFFGSMVIPGWNAKEATYATGDIYTGMMRSKSSLVKENENLHAENVDLKNRMTNYQTLVDENNKIKELFGRTTGQPSILASILVKPAQTIYDTLIIDAGIDEGVAIGKRVFASRTILIGEVSEVANHTAKVAMYSSSGHKMQVVVSGKELFTEATGRGGGTFEMVFPREVEFPVGTEIVAPGITPYLIGLVDEVISDPRDPLQKVLLRSPVNIQEIKFVEVEK